MANPPETQHGDFTSALRELAAADVVAFGGVGFAAQILPPTAAYRLLEEALPERLEELRPELSRLLEKGSPAGRVYAATLLGRVDPAAARAAWESMTRDRAELSTFSGCMMDKTTLGEYASRQLTHRPR